MSSETLYLIIVGGALLWPIVKLLAQIVYKQFESRLPANVQALIEQFASTAVRSAEQQLGAKTGEQKKQLAAATIQALLRAVKLPPVDEDALIPAIEAAVYVLNQEKS